MGVINRLLLQFMDIPQKIFTFTTPDISASLMIIILLGIVALMCLALAWRTWTSNRRHPTNIFYAVTICIVALWVFSLIGIRVATDPAHISLSARMSYFFGALIVFFFYLFTYHFSYKAFIFTKRQYTGLFLATTFILFISLVPGFAVPGVVLSEDRFDPENAFWNVVFTIYYIALIVLSFWNLWIKSKIMDGIWRRRLRQVIIATSAPFVTGFVFSCSFCLSNSN